MKKILLAGVALAALAAGPAMAGSAQGTPFKVSLTVQAGCSIQTDVGAINFAGSNGGGVPGDIQATPSVQCNNGGNYSVYLTSANTTGTPTRILKDPTVRRVVCHYPL